MNIGRASTKSGVSQRMIRHYERIGLIPPPARRDSGYRDYDESDVHRLRFVANARDLGFSVAEIGALLSLWNDQERASLEVKTLALSHIEALDEKIAKLANVPCVTSLHIGAMTRSDLSMMVVSRLQGRL